MTSPRHPLSASRIILVLALTTLLGSLLGLVVAIRLPKKYLGSALIENPAYAGHPPRLSKLRGEMIAREYDFQHRWNTGLEQAGAKVVEVAELKPQPQGLLVSVITDDPKTSHSIALSVARDLGTPQHEAALAAKWKSLTDITEAEAENLFDISQLEYLLNDQSVEAGFPSYAMVVREATEGNEQAAKFARGEDFERRHTMLQSLARKIGFDLPPGSSIITAYNRGKVSPISTEPMFNGSQLAIYVGRFGGLAIGGLMVLALLRWKPGSLRPEPPEAPALTTASATGQSAVPEPNDDPW